MNSQQIFFKNKTIIPQKKVKVGFICPPGDPTQVFQPLAFISMNSHYNYYGKYPEYVEWVEPIYKWIEIKSHEEAADYVCSCDILLFSSYVWNYTMVDEIAKLAKQKNQNVICVLGGPHIGINIPSIFNNRFKYDFICKPMKPGEIFVMDLIDSYFDNNGTPNYNDISWELRSKKTCSQVEFEYSVYREHFEYIKKIAKFNKESVMDVDVGLVYESTRGCPFKCSFCEWGGGLGEKVVKKDMDIVKEDLMAIAEAGWDKIEVADANLAMYKERDLEWLEFAMQQNIKPLGVTYVKLKNYEKKKQLMTDVYNLVKKYEHLKNFKNFSLLHTSIQSISDEAIKLAERVDLTFEEKLKLIAHISELIGDKGRVENIDFMMGMPGSTLEDFYNEFNVYWDIKIDFPRYLYLMLPDAPITEPEYLKKYNIELLEVKGNFIASEFNIPKHSIYRDLFYPYHLIASHFSITKEEMKQMWVMNFFGINFIRTFYKEYEHEIDATNFAKLCWEILQELSEFKEIWDYADNLYNTKTEAISPYHIGKVDYGHYIDNLFSKRNYIIKLKLNRILREQLKCA